MNQLRYDLNRALNQVNVQDFEEALREGRKLIIEYDCGSVAFRWDPPWVTYVPPTLSEIVGSKGD